MSRSAISICLGAAAVLMPACIGPSCSGSECEDCAVIQREAHAGALCTECAGKPCVEHSDPCGGFPCRDGRHVIRLCTFDSDCKGLEREMCGRGGTPGPFCVTGFGAK